MIHNDGTGTELLRYKDVQEYIGDAQLDPITALIREPLPENMKVTGRLLTTIASIKFWLLFENLTCR